MARALHFDCFSGISGDMTLGALLDAGADAQAVRAGLDSLGLPITLHVKKVRKGGFAATQVWVQAPEEAEHRHLPDVEAILARGALTERQRELALRIFRKLAEAFKRVRNIARELDRAPASLTELRRALSEPAEVALLDAIDARRPAIEAGANGSGDLAAAYASAAAFEPVVARFFNEVFVMAENAAVRDARLGLMKQLEELILQLGDISHIVALES